MYCSPENRHHNFHRHNHRDDHNGDDDADREDGDDDDDDDVPETLDAFKGISFHPPVKTGQVVSHPVCFLL